jgi:hypothetical protein
VRLKLNFQECKPEIIKVHIKAVFLPNLSAICPQKKAPRVIPTNMEVGSNPMSSLEICRGIQVAILWRQMNLEFILHRK